MITEIFYVGRDNTIDVQLQADGVAIEMDDVTKVQLVMSATLTVSSDTEPNVFDWDEHKQATQESDRKMIIDLNEKSGGAITAGTYKSYLVVYDPSNTSGIRWDDIRIKVI